MNKPLKWLHRQSGFTLIEVLVVMLVIAIFIGFVSMSAATMRKEEDRITNIAAQLANKFQLVHLEAISNQSLLRFVVQKNQYGFQKYQVDPLQGGTPVWVWVSRDSLLQPQTLPEQVAITITADPSLQQAVWFYPNGEISQYQIVLTGPNQSPIRLSQP